MELTLYNSLSRKKEKFEPINPPHVGLYVCGPTVYGDPHLGHARPAITFDIVFRYLTHLGYKVRYVRNITDVGHLENDADVGEDKIGKKARLEQLEPMEVVQHYTNSYRRCMAGLNVLPPSIEPHASGHIIEQMELIEAIFESGFAYESNGSVYFDVEKYNAKHNYGKLSGRRLEDLMANTRELDGQQEKRNPFDFALWKKADPSHIMRWNSKWSIGFPGWHLECSAMGAKYLGVPFDIHGGGIDLQFPHHECEIAQSVAGHGVEPVKYWMHNNLITINGQKMGKSLGNFITLDEFFTGKHALLSKAYSPMVIRFFILQAQYRGTLDFSDAALQAAESGLDRLSRAFTQLDVLKAGNMHEASDIVKLTKNAYEALNDDFNTPIVIAQLFEAARIINAAAGGQITLSIDQIEALKSFRDIFIFEILGLTFPESGAGNDKLAEVMEMILSIRAQLKAEKNFALTDTMRDQLAAAGIVVKDTKEGPVWEIK